MILQNIIIINKLTAIQTCTHTYVHGCIIQIHHANQIMIDFQLGSFGDKNKL